MPLTSAATSTIGQRLAGPACLSTAAAIWGGLYVVSTIVLGHIPPWVLLEFRILLSLAVLGAVAQVRKSWRVQSADLAALALVGLVGYTLSIGLQFLGTARSGAALGSLVTAASPAFIALFAYQLLREPLRPDKVAAIAVAFAGVCLVVGLSGNMGGAGDARTGNVLLFGAAVTWALYTVLSRRLTHHYSALTVTAWASLFGAIFTAPVAGWQWASSGFVLPTTPLLWVGVAYLGVISTALAFYLWNKGFEYVEAATGSLYFFLQPLVGSALGAVLLGEPISWGFLAGAVLIAGSIYLSSRPAGMRP